MNDILGERDSNVPDTPTRVSEPSRESQLPKRFYKAVEVVEIDGLFRVELDGRPIRTPGKKHLELSSANVMSNIAAEWDVQAERIDPLTMPYTRLTNTAIDGVARDMQAVKEDIVRYASSDLLCYRADQPEGLVARQMALWDPVLEWAQMGLGAQFETAQGVMHVEQPATAMAAFSTHVGVIDDPLVLSATHVATSLTGSAVIAMALLKDEISLHEAWTAAHVDEDWNIELWGSDEEAEARRASRFVDMETAVAVLKEIG